MRAKDQQLRRRRKRRITRLKKRAQEEATAWQQRSLRQEFQRLLQENDDGNLQPPLECLGKVIADIRELSPDLIFHLQKYRSDLDHLNWAVFEHLVAEFLACRGFEDVRLVGRDPATSADIYAAHARDPLGTAIRFFVEVKHHKRPIGIEVINAVLGAMLIEREKHGWHAGVIVSTGGFKDTRRYSKQELDLRGLQLKNKDDLLMWLDDYLPNHEGLWLPNPKKKLPADAISL